MIWVIFDLGSFYDGQLRPESLLSTTRTHRLSHPSFHNRPYVLLRPFDMKGRSGSFSEGHHENVLDALDLLLFWWSLVFLLVDDYLFFRRREDSRSLKDAISASLFSSIRLLKSLAFS